MDRIKIASKIVSDLNIAFGSKLPPSAVDVVIEAMKEFDSEESRPTPLAVDSAIALDEECFSCKKGESMPVEYIAKQYGYKLCKFHADMGLVAGWDIEPIRAATKA